MKYLRDILITIAVIALLLAALWYRISAPCSFYDYTAAKDVPGRCLIEVGK